MTGYRIGRDARLGVRAGIEVLDSVERASLDPAAGIVPGPRRRRRGIDLAHSNGAPSFYWEMRRSVDARSRPAPTFGPDLAVHRLSPGEQEVVAVLEPQEHLS